MFIRNKTKFFRSILLGVLLLSGVIVVVTVVFMSKKGGYFRSDLPENPEISSQAAQESCVINQRIEYLYYKDAGSTWEKNNKFGLYIYAENKGFFELAQKLVNSEGGKWGYVLIPYNVKDRDKEKWTRAFDQLYKKELIPIIQLHDVDLDDYQDQTREAAAFLNMFIWPIKYRYISVYNEPNDSNFWYDKIDPEEYARILRFSVDAFKSENTDFFMLNGAFNVSAASDGVSMDSFEFMKRMNEEIPGIFSTLDGWASHPYPQPNFTGSPNDKGRWSIQAYNDELAYLKELGVEKDLPVFITETGWAHAEGNTYNPSFLPVSVVSDYFKKAFEEIWLRDDRVRAVIPFTIRYDPPFDHFSWVNPDNVPYLHYETVKSLDKVKGEPPALIEGVLEITHCE